MTNQPKDVEELEEADLTAFERELAQAILGALDHRGFYDCGKYLDTTFIEFLRPIITTHTDKRVREEWQKAIELADKIESQYTNTEFNEWRAFKGFRNALDDKLQALSD